MGVLNRHRQMVNPHHSAFQLLPHHHHYHQLPPPGPLPLRQEAPRPLPGRKALWMASSSSGGRHRSDCPRTRKHPLPQTSNWMQSSSSTRAPRPTTWRWPWRAPTQGERTLLITCTHPLFLLWADGLTRVHTPKPRREDVLVLDAAYHGHTMTMMDLSAYKHHQQDHDDDDDTRESDDDCFPKPWVHVVPTPDTYRGPSSPLSLCLSRSIRLLLLPPLTDFLVLTPLPPSPPSPLREAHGPRRSGALRRGRGAGGGGERQGGAQGEAREARRGGLFRRRSAGVRRPGRSVGRAVNRCL